MLFPETDEEIKKFGLLKKLGWIQRDSAPCRPEHEGFYLADGNSSSMEFFFSGKGEFFTPLDLPWPEAPVQCISLEQPLKIEEL